MDRNSEVETLLLRDLRAANRWVCFADLNFLHAHWKTDDRRYATRAEIRNALNRLVRGGAILVKATKRGNLGVKQYRAKPQWRP